MKSTNFDYLDTILNLRSSISLFLSNFTQLGSLNDEVESSYLYIPKSKITPI